MGWVLSNSWERRRASGHKRVCRRAFTRVSRTWGRGPAKASANQDSASERWHAEGLAFGTADGSRGSMGASDSNRTPSSKKWASFGVFGCRSEEDNFGLVLIFS